MQVIGMRWAGNAPKEFRSIALQSRTIPSWPAEAKSRESAEKAMDRTALECPGNEASTWSETASTKWISPVGDPVAYVPPLGAAASAVTAALATGVSA